MASEYVTDSGVIKPTLAECVQDIGDALEQVVGPINREADSGTGQWIGVEAEAAAVHFEALELLWASRSLNTATGYALDAIGTWFGIARNDETETQVNAVIYGTESTLVPVGALASFGNYQFSLESASIISRTALVDGQFKVNNNTEGTYTVRVVGTDLTYTKGASDTVTDIALGLAKLIDATSQFTATSTGSSVYLTSENAIQGYAVSLGAGLSWVSIGSPAIFQATDTGEIVVPVGGLSTPVSAVTGWTGVKNLIAGSTGSNRESDTDYRTRLKAARGSTGGAATEPAIRSHLLSDVEGVTLAEVIENDSMTTNAAGQDAKSIQCVVNGGLEQDVAETIWKYKAAGVATYGTITITVKDSYGRSRDVKFSRPELVSLYVKVDVKLLDTEEDLPASVITLIKEGVENYFATLSLGDDVITQRIYGYIYSNTTGLGKLNVSVSTDGMTFSEDNVSISDTQYANVAEAAIEVSGV
ncbi:Baseplate J-like protein [Rosenbergiella nectarea]|uniref:Baseplate J-like protein n=1 Tax=Rosenbergiella nectarea TaxID=988801 RepID=A0A1H9HQZ7_9GAMM|nr:baseplate J/gp47 family protein [Rosenbergiella nectarea]SEQ64764.1 Baseplate J-like protein [Rosenbergiella nectarea]